MNALDQQINWNLTATTTSVFPNSLKEPGSTFHILSETQWNTVEEQMPNARKGVRVLVHRRRITDFMGEIIIDFITERQDLPNGKRWKHITSYYRKEENHPYTYQYDASHLFVE